jgi:hypothetical protein
MRQDTRSAQEREALEAGEAGPIDMSVERVLSEARRRTDLDDFGPSEFTSRLHMLLQEVEADENVWNIHKAQFVEQCVKAAANRLMIQNYRTSHPDAVQQPIDQPINVVALPRSGSTHLENLLAADRRLRHLPVYLAAQPAPLPREAAAVPATDPRWTRASERWAMMSQNTIMAAMHEHSPDHACGENELQIPDFASYQWEWLAFVPHFRDYYLSHDQSPHYRYMREVLQIVAHQFPGDQRWMLKSNQHGEQLGPLLTAYPDATVVMIHRDPVATLQSLLTMRGLAFKASRKSPDIDTHVDYWLCRIERMLRSYLRDRHLVPPDQLVEVKFADVIADDIGVASSVLERAGLPADEQSIAGMQAYMTDHRRGRGGKVVYDLEGDFGLDADELGERFRFYTDAFGIRPERSHR